MFAISFVARAIIQKGFLNMGLSRTGHWRMGSEIDCYAATVSSALPQAIP
jgi:hypothetical protein